MIYYYVVHTVILRLWSICFILFAMNNWLHVIDLYYYYSTGYSLRNLYNVS